MSGGSAEFRAAGEACTGSAAQRGLYRVRRVYVPEVTFMRGLYRVRTVFVQFWMSGHLLIFSAESMPHRRMDDVMHATRA